MEKKGVLLFVFILLIAILMFKADAANHKFLVKDNTTNFTVTFGGPNTYKLNVYFNVSSANNGNATSPINATFYMPWGMRPQTINRCNATQGFRRINITTVACSINIAYRINSAPRFKNNTQINLTIIENLSAFPHGLKTAEKFWVEIASNGTGTVKNTTSALRRFGVPYKINPRPYANRTYTSWNTTFRFIFWNQTRSSYEIWVPIFGFNTTSGRPTIANNTYADIVFVDKSFFDTPTLFELWSYRLNFTIYFNGAKNATYNVYINSINTTAQIIYPLAISTFSVPTLDKVNVTRTFLIPSQNGGFSVWFNKTWYTNTTLSSQFKINVSYNPIFGNGAEPEKFRLFTVRAPGRYGGNVNLSILLSTVTASGQAASPFYVENQHITGFNPATDAAPEAGKNKTMQLKVQAKNLMQNFTLRQLKLRFLIPLNVSIQNGSKPKNKLVYSYNVTWLDTAGVWNYTLAKSIMTRQVECASVIDHMAGSPSNGRNITICFYNYFVNLTSTKFNNWDPGNLPVTNITANMTAVFSFPVMNITENTPDTPGSTNIYNATISMSQAGKLNLTSQITGIDSSDTNVIIKVDGLPLTGNYTIGSLVLNSVSQGTHSISVSYQTPSSPLGVGAGSSGGSSISSKSVNTILSFRVRDSFRFTVKNIRHQLTLDELDSVSKIASFTLASTNPRQFTLKESESQLFDTDDNGLNDLNITVINIDFRRALTSIKEIVELQPTTTILPSLPLTEVTGEIVAIPEPQIVREEVIVKEQPSSYKRLITSAIILFVFAIIGFVVYEKYHQKNIKKHSKKK